MTSVSAGLGVVVAIGFLISEKPYYTKHFVTPLKITFMYQK